MLKMSHLTVAGAGLALALPAVLAPSPALAQNGRISEISVYGTDPCPRSTDDEVVVCARKPESERYRIPEALRQGGSIQSRTAWAERARVFETVSDTGINSCSPVGPAGYTGCTVELINEAFRARRAQNKEETAPE